MIIYYQKGNIIFYFIYFMINIIYYYHLFSEM